MNEKYGISEEDNMKIFNQLQNEYNSGCNTNPSGPTCDNKRNNINQTAYEFRNASNRARKIAENIETRRKKSDYIWKRKLKRRGWWRRWYWVKHPISVKRPPIEWQKWNSVVNSKTKYDNNLQLYNESCKDNPNGEGCVELNNKKKSVYNTVISNMAAKTNEAYNKTTMVRNEVATGFNALKNVEGFGDNTVKFRRTMQLSLLWTVLATCLLFYLFKQI